MREEREKKTENRRQTHQFYMNPRHRQLKKWSINYTEDAISMLNAKYNVAHKKAEGADFIIRCQMPEISRNRIHSIP